MRDDHRIMPLRRIVGPAKNGGDLLECGHDLPEASDIFGQRPSGSRRRCYYCWKELSEEDREFIRQRSRDLSKLREDRYWQQQREWAEKRRTKE